MDRHIEGLALVLQCHTRVLHHIIDGQRLALLEEELKNGSESLLEVVEGVRGWGQVNTER